MKNYICSLLFLGASLASIHGYAQGEAPTTKEASKKPLWMPMLEDTTANFFEVERVFNAYFKTHEMPDGEDEEIGEHAEREKFPSKRERRRANANSDLRLAVKRYVFWRRKVLPYVQDDGRILTPSERIALWKAQQP